ncbi:MAG: mannose-1-phosphate guanyltransferase [Chlorobiales bacterium]|nr:mannose-1-phosphate guanyltransferase [Chlorobiales bacterium]
MQFPVEHLYAVIMAGGTGGLMLWPCSRKKTPKQFIDVFGGGTMIESAIARMKESVPLENIYVVTNAQGEMMMRRSLPGFPAENILVEPVARDTAPCIALATAYISKKDPEAIMVAVPADLLVLDKKSFGEILNAGVAVAQDRKTIITIGVTPDRPETEYGYIQVDRLRAAEDCLPDSTVPMFTVRAFAEKPDSRTAQEFIDSGDFYWNSGVLIWHIDVIRREFERSMPDLYKDLQSIYDVIGTDRERSVIEDVYSWLHPVSIAYGIMEKAESVCMLAGDFGWTDLGNWDDVLKIDRRDIELPESVDFNLVQVGTANNFVKKAGKKAVAIVGLEDIIVIDTEDALLICRKGQSQDVRKVIDILRREGFEDYL